MTMMSWNHSWLTSLEKLIERVKLHFSQEYFLFKPQSFYENYLNNLETKKYHFLWFSHMFTLEVAHYVEKPSMIQDVDQNRWVAKIEKIKSEKKWKWLLHNALRYSNEFK